MPMSVVDTKGARQQFHADGFLLVPPVLSPEMVGEANRQMDRVIAGDYVTGVPPLGGNWTPGEEPSHLIKIDQPQLADGAIADLFASSGIGAQAAALTGASMVEVWAVQLLHKPPSRAGVANVGWHQDDDYWHDWWEGEVFTCWLALSDVTSESGPLRFVRGSHEWGFLASGNFFDGDLDAIRSGMTVPDGAEWEEVPAVLPPGGASFHHRRVIHGSGPNETSEPRRSYAIHLRTERSRSLPTAPDIWREQWESGAGTTVIHGV